MSKITEADITNGSRFKLADGEVFVVDEVQDDPKYGKLVRTSKEGGPKGNYRDLMAELVDFLNEEGAVNELASHGSYASGAVADPLVLKEFDVVDHENNLVTTLAVDNGADYAEARKVAMGMLKHLFPQEYPHLKLLYAGAQSQMFELGGIPGDDLIPPDNRCGWHEKLKAIFLKNNPENAIAGEPFKIQKQRGARDGDDLSVKFRDDSGLTFTVLKTTSKKFRIRVSSWTENPKADWHKTIAKRILEEKIEPLMAIFGTPIKKDMEKKAKGGNLDSDWEKRAKDALIGKEIRTATYLTADEARGMAWGDSDAFKHCLVLEFKDKSYILPASDDEGNDAGFFDLTCSHIAEEEYNTIRKHLPDAIITDAHYMHPEMAKTRLLSHRPLILNLKKTMPDKSFISFTITAMKDPEGNDAGAVFGQTADKKELDFPMI